jgi:hypothetical protein
MPRKLPTPKPPPITPGTDWTQAQRAARGELMVSRRIRPEDTPIWYSVVQPGEAAGATIWRLVMAEAARIERKTSRYKKSTRNR